MAFHRKVALILAMIVGIGGLEARYISGQNHPPNTPVITEPSNDGNIVNPADVHMETAPFSDPDPGNTHLCTDWEIWSDFPLERVWVTSCIGGVEKVHTHLGDGIFENSHAGRSTLMHDKYYTLQARHRDSSGDPLTEWSAWSMRGFQTAPEYQVFPLMLDDIATTPAAQWTDEVGGKIILTPGTPPPTLRIESSTGLLLSEIRPLDGVKNRIVDSASLGLHLPVRVVVFGGSQGLVLPESHVAFTDHAGIDRTLYLPSAAIAAFQQTYYWISVTGASYFGTSAQTDSDFTHLARGPTIPWSTNEPGYRVEIAATGFQLPVNIAFVPTPGLQPTDPYYYVSELYGRIKTVLRNGTIITYTDNLLNFNPTGNFPGSGEEGLSGIVVDSATGDLFGSLLYDSEPPDGPHFPKVVRFHSTDGGITASSQTTVLDMPGETMGESHFISNLSIGPDRKLYVHTGDGFDEARALDLDSFRGKVLRVNFDGTAPTDNPFYDPGDGITARDYIFAYGFRNPFGGTWRASDGSHYEVENGTDINDRLARVTAGTSYGWDGSGESLVTNAVYNWPTVHAPVNIVFVQPSTFNGSGFPSEKMDHAFVTESGPTWDSGPQGTGKRIVEFVISQGGSLVSGPSTLAEYVGAGKATAVGLAAGPEGLYFTDLYKDLNYTSAIDSGANVLRLKFVGVAMFKANVTSGNAPFVVQFTDTSSVPNPSSWLWDFGDSSTSTAQNPTHIYIKEGSYNVRLTVAGPRGSVAAQKNDYIVVSIGPPLATQFSAFTASLSVGSHVQLSWTTISELNNYGFYVQRRTSTNQSFTDIQGSFVPGHATSIVEHKYSFVDSLAPVGTLSYRLRQVDLDSAQHFSDTVAINVVTNVAEREPALFALFQNYPNPFNPQTEIKFSVDAIGHTTLNVFNTLGQQVATLFDDVAEPGRYYRVRFDGRNIASGVYFYRIQNAGRSQLKKLVLLK